MLVDLIVEKVRTRDLWEIKLGETAEIPTFVELSIYNIIFLFEYNIEHSRKYRNMNLYRQAHDYELFEITWLSYTISNDI